MNETRQVTTHVADLGTPDAVVVARGTGPPTVTADKRLSAGQLVAIQCWAQAVHDEGGVTERDGLDGETR